MSRPKLHGLLLALVLGSCASAPTLYEHRLVDLTHTVSEGVADWPGEPTFRYERRAGIGPDGRWNATGAFSGSELSGTHIEAPMHYAEGRRGASELPLSQLVGPVRVIDVSKACEDDPRYVVQLSDLRRHERDHGRIPLRAIVLVHTGWDRHWGTPDRYYGTLDSARHPGLSLEFARELVSRKVDLVGIDGPSLDSALDLDTPVQRLFAENNQPALENLTGLDQLPPLGATLIALPVKLDRAGGAPARVIAIVP
jgi:kynurenine formamidase